MLLKDAKDQKLKVQIDISKPLLGQETVASGLQFSQSSSHGKIVAAEPQHSRHMSLQNSNIDLAEENQYRSYYDKQSNQDKLKIISEDFIDDLIAKRKQMSSTKGQNVEIHKDKILKMKQSHQNENRIPNVASISGKKTSQLLHHGSGVKLSSRQQGYTFNQTAAKDMKTLNIQRNKAIEEYRKAIQDTMKVLDGAQRKPIDEQDKFKEHIRQLKQQLSDIENSVEIDQKMATKYPGSTGNGDAKAISQYNESIGSKIFSADMPKSLVPYNKQNSFDSGPAQIQEQDTFIITKKHMSNLKIIYKFYACMHIPIENKKETFDDIANINSKMNLGEFLKFCQNFEIPITKKDQMEVFRKIAIKQNCKVANFETFCEILKEIFFVKETEQAILQIRREIKVLDESNLKWSMEKKADALKHIEKLQLAMRSKEKDHMYFSQAHQYLQTEDKELFMHKLKSFRIPFQQRLVEGQKIEEFDHKGQPFNNWKTSAETVHVDSKAAEKYDNMIHQYLDRRERKQAIKEKQIQDTFTVAQQAVRNSQKYYDEYIKKPSILGVIESNPQMMELRKNSLKRYPQKYQELGNMRDLRNHKNEAQRTSWTDLRAINYQQNEEYSIKQLLGIPIDKKQTKEGLGGGGQESLRQQLSLNKISQSGVRSQVQSQTQITPMRHPDQLMLAADAYHNQSTNSMAMSPMTGKQQSSRNKVIAIKNSNNNYYQEDFMNQASPQHREEFGQVHINTNIGKANQKPMNYNNNLLRANSMQSKNVEQKARMARANPSTDSKQQYSGNKNQRPSVLALGGNMISRDPYGLEMPEKTRKRDDKQMQGLILRQQDDFMYRKNKSTNQSYDFQAQSPQFSKQGGSINLRTSVDLAPTHPIGMLGY